MFWEVKCFVLFCKDDSPSMYHQSSQPVSESDTQEFATPPPPVRKAPKRELFMRAGPPAAGPSARRSPV